MQVTCQGCGSSFGARRKTAKWCSEACRKATGRRAGTSKPADGKPAPKGAAAGNPTSSRKLDPLEVATRTELTKVGQLESVDGQIALHLAKQVKAATGSSAATLARELRQVLDRAVAAGAAAPPPTEGPAEPAPADDEVTKAREARDAKLRAATGRA